MKEGTEVMSPNKPVCRQNIHTNTMFVQYKNETGGQVPDQRSRRVFLGNGSGENLIFGSPKPSQCKLDEPMQQVIVTQTSVEDIKKKITKMNVETMEVRLKILEYLLVILTGEQQERQAKNKGIQRYSGRPRETHSL